MVKELPLSAHPSTPLHSRSISPCARTNRASSAPEDDGSTAIESNRNAASGSENLRKNKRIFILFGIPDGLFGVILHIPLGICKKFGEVEKSTFEARLAFPARFCNSASGNCPILQRKREASHFHKTICGASFCNGFGTTRQMLGKITRNRQSSSLSSNSLWTCSLMSSSSTKLSACLLNSSETMGGSDCSVETTLTCLPFLCNAVTMRK